MKYFSSSYHSIIVYQSEFNLIPLLQVFNEINSREMEKINVLHGILSNWIFVAILTSTIIFQVIIVELLGPFASTKPLSWQLWLISVMIGSISIIVAIILKWIPVESNKCTTVHHQNGYEALPSGPEAV